MKLDEEARELYGNMMFDRYLFTYDAVITKPVTYSQNHEVHRTGITVRDPIRWSVIAPSREYADVAFDQRFRGRFNNVDPEITSCTFIPVCAEIKKMQER